MKSAPLAPSRDLAAADAVPGSHTGCDHAAADAPPRSDAAWHRLVDAASARYRRAGRFAYHFARGKLSRDPVFRALLEQGDLSGASHLLDIGCGQALLASLLAACEAQAGAGAWPADWPAAPPRLRYTGLELMPRDVARAQAALAGLSQVQVTAGDMREAVLPACDLVVILDVLHYVDHAAQRRVLERVHAALAPRGRLLLRIGDAQSRWRYAASQWVDRVVATLRGHRAPPTWGRPLAQWQAVLRDTGFDVQPRWMSRGTPFANVLLVCDKARASGAHGPGAA